MHLYFFKAPDGNFGDDINEWLWHRLLGNKVNQISNDVTMIGIGTILDHHIPFSAKYIVFGSGAGYHSLPKSFGSEEWDIKCVRGPLTAKYLEISEDKAITDSAILIALLEEFSPVDQRKRNGIVFMPHIGAILTGEWEKVCEKAGIEYIDPRDDSVTIIERIRNAKLVLADAMHAAIVADTLRVPWVPLVTSSEINSFKWIDWTSSMGLPYEPSRLSSSTLLDSFKGLVHSIFKLNYRLSPHNSEDELVMQQKRLLNARSGKWHKYTNRLAKFLIKRISKLVKKISYLNKLHIKLSESKMERVSLELRQVAENNGYISHDLVFTTKLKQMKEKLSEIKEA